LEAWTSGATDPDSVALYQTTQQQQQRDSKFTVAVKALEDFDAAAFDDAGSALNRRTTTAFCHSRCPIHRASGVHGAYRKTSNKRRGLEA